MSTTTLKSETVKDYLLEEIRSGKYRSGECLPSDNQLTAITGMSRTTVRDAISQLVSAGYMERIQGKGTFVLCTEPQRRSPAESISLFVADSMTEFKGNPFIEEILFGIHQSLLQKGIGVTLTSFGDKETCQDKLIDGKIPGSWSGGVILTAGYSSKTNIDFLLKHQVPCVSIGRPLCSADISYVDTDHFAGGYAAVEHLVELGHRQIAFFDSSYKSTHFLSTEDRRRGITQALNDLNIPGENRIFLEALESDEGEVSAVVKNFFDSDSGTTGIIVYGHRIYKTLMQEAATRNIRIPEDLSIIYCMGYQKLSEHFGVITTTVIQPLRDMGGAATEMLLEGAAKGNSRIFRPYLSPGLTTRHLNS